jgi:hypothetical protein
MPWATAEKRAAWSRGYYRANRAAVTANKRRWTAANPEKRRAQIAGLLEAAQRDLALLGLSRQNTTEGGLMSALRVPSPADVPTMNARELIARIQGEGGRVLRMKQSPSVFVLTDNEQLVDWLFDRGATTFRDRNVRQDGSYKRASGGSDEWDVWIHPIPVLGDESIWEAAAR